MRSSRAELSRRHVDALGINTHYYEAGERNGRPLILLHGMSSSGDSYREFMHELAGEQWLIAPDIPGFGYSAHTDPYTIPHLVEWLAAFIDALEISEAQLVGHSFGGLLSGAYTLAYPEDVAGLLLMAPALLAAQSYPEWARRVSASIDFLGMMELGVAVSQSRVMVDRVVRASFYDPERHPETLWERRLTDYDHARASANVLKAAARYDLTPRLDQLQQPIWIIWGSDDPVLNLAQADRLAALMPHSQLFVLPQCGHAPLLERREEVLVITQAFLAESAASA